jgi:acetyl esterase/lipase
MRSLSALCVALVITGLVGAAEVEVVKDIAYTDGTGPDADAAKQALDLYLPRGEKDFPVLMFIHGGAWVIGDRKGYGFVGETFARNGIGTAVISYRLSPKVQHPAHIQDVAKAFAWLKKNIARSGGDPRQLYVCGHSAGGHLTALLATDDSYLKAEGLSLGDIKGAIPMSGVYEIMPGLLASPIFGKDETVLKKASPLQHVTDGHPPMLVVYADKDFPNIDRMSERFCNRLKECKCEAELLELKDRTHITIIGQIPKDGDPATRCVLEFIAKHSGVKLKALER